MDKETLYTYGLTIVSIVVLFILVAAITPTAIDVEKEIDSNVDTLVNSMDDFDDAAVFNKSEYCILTIQYQFKNEDGTSNTSKSYETKTYVKIGERYDVKVPDAAGFVKSVNDISGIIDTDTLRVVTYTPDNITISADHHLLIIKYQFENNGDISNASKNYETQIYVKKGDTFNEGVPDVEGFSKSTDKVSGTMGEEDISYTVVYTPTT